MEGHRDCPASPCIRGEVEGVAYLLLPFLTPCRIMNSEESLGTTALVAPDYHLPSHFCLRGSSRSSPARPLHGLASTSAKM